MQRLYKIALFSISLKKKKFLKTLPKKENNETSLVEKTKKFKFRKILKILNEWFLNDNKILKTYLKFKNINFNFIHKLQDKNFKKNYTSQKKNN